MIADPTSTTAVPERMAGYDAAESSGRRKAPAIRTGSEDTILPQAKRWRMQGAANDLGRNYSVAAWAVRKHLDFVSAFTFRSRTGIPELDKQINDLVTDQSKPARCDAAGRHSLGRLVRIAEARRTLDGDVGVNRLNDMTVQLVESDRIRSGGEASGDEWINGVKVTRRGRAMAYAVWNRGRYGGFEYERAVAARFMRLHGYYDRNDQVRGVSPLAAGINTLQDTYEGFDYALAKMKVSQIFALAFYRDAVDAESFPIETDASTEGIDADSTETRYKADFGKGPIGLDLEPGDRAEILESKNPSSEFQAFTQACIAVALKSLDIPYSFYDEAHTNFFGSRAALTLYMKSAEDKREGNRELLDWWTGWQVANAVATGRLALAEHGLTVADLRWTWNPRGLPWWDKGREVAGDVAAIEAGLDTRTQVARERTGRDYRDIIDELADEQAYAEDKGVALSIAGGQVFNGVTDTIVKASDDE